VDWQAWYTLAVIAATLAALVRNIGPADMVLWAGTILVTLPGIVAPQQVLSGFADPGLLTVAALFVVSGGLRETGALDRIGARMFGGARTERGVVLRIAPQVAALSAFLNNTAVVAMLMPVLGDWCRKHRISPSRLMMPLSFATILGGMCTLIGTSTNLVVNSLMVEAGLAPMSLFELAAVGVPATVVGIAYLVVLGGRLLPDRKDLLEQIGESAREYLVEMRIEPGCPLAGKSVEQAGLRRLPGLFLIEIMRAGRVVAPVEPDEVLLAGDHLTFAGVVQTIVDLERIPGLVPVAEDRSAQSAEQKRQRRYCEAVVSATSPLVARNIRDANFRALYNAAVIAVHRGGERLKGRIGDIVIHAGDTLLLQTGPHFAAANRNNPDFYLVSGIEEARPVRHERSLVAFGLLGVLVLLLLLGERLGITTVVAAFLVAGAMIATRCISAADARRTVNLDVLLTIAAAFGLGRALEASGAAAAIADVVVRWTGGWGPTAALAAVYLVTVCFTTLITNNAAAVLAFPLAMAVAREAGVDPRPLALTVALGASASFATPTSYQTNMMVYGAGGYRFTDFVRVGLPLNLLLLILTLVLLPRIWPL